MLRTNKRPRTPQRVTARQISRSFLCESGLLVMLLPVSYKPSILKLKQGEGGTSQRDSRPFFFFFFLSFRGVLPWHMGVPRLGAPSEL